MPLYGLRNEVVSTVCSLSPLHADLRLNCLASVLRKMVARIGLDNTLGLDLSAQIAGVVCTRVYVRTTVRAIPRDQAEAIRCTQHHGNRCVHCGLCETLCPARTIEG